MAEKKKKDKLDALPPINELDALPALEEVDGFDELPPVEDLDLMEMDEATDVSMLDTLGNIGSYGMEKALEGIELYESMGPAPMRSALMAGAVEGADPMQEAEAQFMEPSQGAPTGAEISEAYGVPETPGIVAATTLPPQLREDQALQQEIDEMSPTLRDEVGVGVDLATDPLNIPSALGLTGKGVKAAAKAIPGAARLAKSSKDVVRDLGIGVYSRMAGLDPDAARAFYKEFGEINPMLDDMMIDQGGVAEVVEGIKEGFRGSISAFTKKANNTLKKALKTEDNLIDITPVMEKLKDRVAFMSPSEYDSAGDAAAFLKGAIDKAFPQLALDVKRVQGRNKYFFNGQPVKEVFPPGIEDLSQDVIPEAIIVNIDGFDRKISFENFIMDGQYMINPADLYDLKRAAQQFTYGRRGKDGIYIKSTPEEKKLGREISFLLKTELHNAIPEVAAADDALSRIHRIQDSMIGRALQADKSPSALLSAASGRGASGSNYYRMLKEVQDLINDPMSVPFETRKEWYSETLDKMVHQDVITADQAEKYLDKFNYDQSMFFDPGFNAEIAGDNLDMMTTVDRLGAADQMRKFMERGGGFQGGGFGAAAGGLIGSFMGPQTAASLAIVTGAVAQTLSSPLVLKNALKAGQWIENIPEQIAKPLGFMHQNGQTYIPPNKISDLVYNITGKRIKEGNEILIKRVSDMMAQPGSDQLIAAAVQGPITGQRMMTSDPASERLMNLRDNDEVEVYVQSIKNRDDLTAVQKYTRINRARKEKKAEND